MKAVVVETPEKITVVERDIPEITSTQVLLKVKAAGICGSDVGIYHGKNAFATYPRVVGHEFVGEVVKVGADVKNAAVGDHIAVDPVVSCGHCYACRTGRHNVCKTVNVLGVHRDGGYQEYVAVEQDQLHQLPKDLPWEIAATVEPYSIGAQVAHQGRLTGDDTVLICGAGPIGLIILQVAKMKGAKVAILDVVDSRLETAKEMGADMVINSKPSPAGRVVVLGFSTVEFPIRQVDIMSKELEIIGTRLNNYRFPEVIEWFKEGKVDPKSIVTNTVPFTEADKAFKYNDEHPENVLKIVLTF